MRQSDIFFQQHDEPVKETMLALRDIILQQDKDVSAAWKYGMPFFCFKGKMFCYLWVHKMYRQPYIGMVEGKRFTESFLMQEGRSRMKIMLIDPDKDLTVHQIEKLLQKALNFYKTGEIKIKC